jgi:hypothetical protein
LTRFHHVNVIVDIVFDLGFHRRRELNVYVSAAKNKDANEQDDGGNDQGPKEFLVGVFWQLPKSFFFRLAK